MQITSTWLARIILILFLYFLFFSGAGIALIGLNDADTCWLLAIGRWIVEHGTLPVIDPFSAGVSTYATIIPGWPLAQYQWLAEILFYCMYKFGGLSGLLILVSMVTCITYVILPYLILQKANCPKIVTFLLIFMGLTLDSFRWAVRPQVFSFLFMAILIYVFIPSNKTSRITLSKVLVASWIMLLWANTHIYFPIGILFIVIVALATGLENLFFEKTHLSSWWPILLAPAAALIATCINPWGYALWTYVYRLGTAPNNYLLQEIDPFNLFELSNRNSIFLLLLIAAYVSCYGLFRIFSIKKSGVLSPSLVIAGLCIGVKHAIFLPMSTLFIIAGLAELIKRQSVFSQQFKIENYLQSLIPKRTVWLTSLLVIMSAGTLAYALLYPPSLPHASAYFEPPFEAINFLKNSQPIGKVFNDPLFGSMMIWYLDKPQVFYDSRFSQYDPNRMLEYLHINNCDSGYEKIWAKYDFDWVFIRSSAQLVNTLHKIGWKIIYKDKVAIVMSRPENTQRTNIYTQHLE